MVKLPEQKQYQRSRTFFWVTFLLAAALSLYLGRHPDAGSTPALAACGLMLSYLGISRLVTPLVLSHEDYADGFYYLGFLLTLVALVATLVSLGDVAEDDVQRLVLSRFGLALSTTVLGLLVRTALRMFQEAEDESSLDAMYRAQEDLRRASEALRVVLQNAGTDLQTTLATASSRIDSELGGLAQKIGTLSGGIEKTSDRLAPLSEGFEAADAWARSFTEQLMATTQESERLGQRMQAASQSIESVSVESQRIVGRLNDLAGSVSIVGDAATRLEALNSAIVEQLQTLERVATGVATIPDVGEKVRALVQSIEKGNDSIIHFTGSVRDSGAAIERMGSAANSLDPEELGRFQQVLERRLDSLEKGVASWELALTRLQKVTDALVRAEQDAAAPLLNVQKELTIGVQFLRELADGKGRK